SLKAAAHLPVADEALAAALAAAMAAAMADAPAVLRHRLTTLIVTRGRTALAERLLAPVRQSWGDAAAARLLPGCGPETVARYLPELFLAVTQWRNLARRHPDPLLDEVARQLAELPEPARAAWWQRNADVLAAAAGHRPERVLDLLERHCPTWLPRPVQECLGRLLTAVPGRTIRLITPPERAATASVSRSALTRIARLDPPELPDLGRAWSTAPMWLARLLRALPPSRREAFYDLVTADRDLSRSELSEAVLDALPRRRAQAEARRMAAQAAERGAAWSVVLAHVAHLPVAEARPRLLAATRRPAAEDRALAYPLLVRNAARSGEPAAVGELLDDLLRLRNEQDPVRSPALVALAAVPPALFRGEAAAAALARIVTDAVEARDTSWQARRALSDLALAVLREHAASGEQPLLGWALATLRQLSGTLGSVPLGRLDTVLRRGQEAQVFEALRPWLEAGADRVDHTLTFALAGALGRRAHHLPELQELLWEAVQFGDNATVIQAVRYWLADPATRGERVARVLELEPSAAVLPPVLQVLARGRTDLLDTVLADTPPYGRFLTAGTRWLPPVDGIECWTPVQQAAAARLLAKAAGDASLPRQVRAGHLRTVVAVPERGFATVRPYVDSPDTVLAEAALGALIWTDRPAEALPLLLAQAGNDRARVALYAAGRAAGFVAPSRLAGMLRAALLPVADGAMAADAAVAAADGGVAVGGEAAGGVAAGGGAKVTSRKELVRLAARLLPVDTAGALLAEVHDLPGQHRDVRAAVVAAAVELLPAPAAWRLLEDAATGAPVARSAVLRTRPLDLPTADRPRYAALVARVAGGDDPQTAQVALDLLAAWSPWYPEAEELLLAGTVDLANRSSWRAAAAGLAALAVGGTGRRLTEALARLLASEAAVARTPEQEDGDGDGDGDGGGLDAAADRDRPARPRIDHLVARLADGVANRPSAEALTAVGEAVELLSAEADFIPKAIQLMTATLEFDTTKDHLLADLDRLAALHGDRPVLAARTADALRSRLNTPRRPGDPAVLHTVTERLAAHGGHTQGLFAVGLAHALGPRTGWRPQWRALLRTLRRHPQPDVREAALAVRTATE
ncbi:hypothetical protein ACFU6K_22375, partial [Kitasatospora sp. NPDC057512]|uniref:hypothetical protein n=1 Tax=Kitasatospora sp. NPDC057512 TaxID=3346154 RepID=UPI0036AEF378